MKHKNNVIVFTGGGSGGHLTPILSVAHAIKAEAPATKLVYVGQHGDPVAAFLHQDPIFASTHTVYAGKLRRYHGEGAKQLLDVKTQAKNMRDMLLTLVGLVQSWFLLRKIAPKIVFCKGGFVSVPVGLASATLGIPYVTHDSDSIPGLANRIISRWAMVHAVAMPPELYAYPLAKTVSVGVPIKSEFTFVTEKSRSSAREKLGIPLNVKVLLVIGGGLGAQRVNQAVIKASKSLFNGVSHLYILHVAGLAGEIDTNQGYAKELEPSQLTKVKVYGFTNEVATLGAAADVVITRAGATNLAEFAVQGKACIIIPNPMLTGGHQPKNAAVYQSRNAAIVLPETELQKLSEVTTELLKDNAKQKELGQNMTQFANKDAALSLAHVILAVAKKDS